MFLYSFQLALYVLLFIYAVAEPLHFLLVGIVFYSFLTVIGFHCLIQGIKCHSLEHIGLVALSRLLSLILAFYVKSALIASLLQLFLYLAIKDYLYSNFLILAVTTLLTVAISFRLFVGLSWWSLLSDPTSSMRDYNSDAFIWPWSSIFHTTLNVEIGNLITSFNHRLFYYRLVHWNLVFLLLADIMKISILSIFYGFLLREAMKQFFAAIL